MSEVSNQAEPLEPARLIDCIVTATNRVAWLYEYGDIKKTREENESAE